MSLTDMVTRARGGDSLAVTELYEGYKSDVYFLCSLLTGAGDAVAAELTQSSFLHAFHKIDFLKNPDNFRPWLLATAVRRCRSYLYERNPEIFLHAESARDENAADFDISESGAGNKLSASDSDRRAVIEAVSSLDILERTAVLIYFFCRMTLSQTARNLGAEDNVTAGYLVSADEHITKAVTAVGIEWPGIAALYEIFDAEALRLVVPDSVGEVVIGASVRLIEAANGSVGRAPAESEEISADRVENEAPETSAAAAVAAAMAAAEVISSAGKKAEPKEEKAPSPSDAHNVSKPAEEAKPADTSPAPNQKPQRTGADSVVDEHIENRPRRGKSKKQSRQSERANSRQNQQQGSFPVQNANNTDGRGGNNRSAQTENNAGGKRTEQPNGSRSGNHRPTNQQQSKPTSGMPNKPVPEKAPGRKMASTGKGRGGTAAAIIAIILLTVVIIIGIFYVKDNVFGEKPIDTSKETAGEATSGEDTTDVTTDGESETETDADTTETEPITETDEVTTDQTASELDPDATAASSFTYTESDGGIVISKFSGSESEVNIPSVIDGKQVTEIARRAFRGNTAITAVSVPASVKTIGASAFEGCTVLRSVTIAEGVTEIGDYAFLDCTALEDITIPSSVTRAGSTILGKTPWLESKTDDFVIIGDGVLIKYNGSARDITVPSGVKMIANVFYYNSIHKSVTLPDTLREIGRYAFYKCLGIKTITIPASVTTIHDDALGGCTAITSINVPEGSVAANWIAASEYAYALGAE